MKRTHMLLRLAIFIVIVISLLMYQQYRKNEFVSYLTALNECFADMEDLQRLSIEANKAGMSGNPEKEAEYNAQLVQRSQQFLAPFESVEVRARTLRKFHDLFLQLNASTHELLVYRIEALSQIKTPNISNEEKQQKIATFWQMQEDNKKLYRKLGEGLHKYAKRLGLKISDHLTNFMI